MSTAARHSLAALALTASLTGTALGAEPIVNESLTNEKILRNFDIIAFGNEYTGKRYDAVRKWKKPIRVGILGKHPGYFDKDVRSHIRDIWNITHFPIELRYSVRLEKSRRLAKDFDKGEVNFVLFYFPSEKIPGIVAKLFKGKVKAAEVADMLKISTCHARYFTKDNEITLAYAVFPAEHIQANMRACVIEEITQVMGLANDSPEVNPSIFHDRGRYNELTEHDRWMLKMFYDPRITAGMEREAAISTGRVILNEIRPGK